LFDLVEDPLEQRNLWGDPVHTAIKDRLLSTLIAWLHKHPSRTKTLS